MGTYSTWINLLGDPNDIDVNIYNAFAALDHTIDELYRALHITFTSSDPVFTGVTSVAGGLNALATEIAALGAANPPVVAGYSDAALVDATLIMRWAALYAGVLGLGSFYVTTVSSGGACTLTLSKNGAPVATITIPESINGPLQVDFSMITCAEDDIFTLETVTVNGAEGLSYMIQV
jgi:hypothetical protein